MTVPGNGTTNDVVVTVGGLASNDATFVVIPRPTVQPAPSSGFVGDPIVLTGGSFGSSQGSSTVTFNGTAATPTSWTDSQIVVPVPASATTGNLIVTVNGGPSVPDTFTVLNLPTITGLSPSSGTSSTSVTVTGTRFGATKGSSHVAFNGINAATLGWSDTSITATVPLAATTGPVVVTVGGYASNGYTFTAPPLIGYVTPDPANLGLSGMSIHGTNFGKVQGANIVTFNGVAAEVFSWKENVITTRLPGPGPIVVTVNGVSSNSMAFTLITEPGIFSIDPDAAAMGSSLLIQGMNFGATQGSSSVKINGATASIVTWANDRVVASVPSGASSTGIIELTVGSLTAEYPYFEVVSRPTISSLSPTTGAIGASVHDHRHKFWDRSLDIQRRKYGRVQRRGRDADIMVRDQYYRAGSSRSHDGICRRNSRRGRQQRRIVHGRRSAGHRRPRTSGWGDLEARWRFAVCDSAVAPEQ